jgi:hypothetical protein
MKVDFREICGDWIEIIGELKAYLLVIFQIFETNYDFGWTSVILAFRWLDFKFKNSTS